MFEMTPRVGIAVYLYYNRDARKLSKYGDIIYQSRRLRYLILYVKSDEADQIITELSQQKFIKEVKVSQLGQIDRDFVGSLQRENIENN